MHRLRFDWRLWMVLAAWAIGLALCSEAMDSTALAESDAQIDESSAAEPGILLLRTGVIVEGRILKSGENYTVKRPNGEMFVPGSLVRMRCESVREAYRKLREGAKQEGTASAHIALAKWCITNHMLGEAREELNDALVLEPDRGETRDLVRRLEALLNPEKAEKKETKTDLTSAPLPPRFTADEIESLGGLSRTHAQQFTRRIQPILVNNCAAAGCHGAESETGFQLQRVVRGESASRIAAERNLAEVLAQIDFKTPRSSALLTTPDSNHGRRGKPAFAGPRGMSQFKELRKWVMGVAKSDIGRQKREESGVTAGGVIQQTGSVEHAQSTRRSPHRPSTDEPAGAPFPRRTTDPFGLAQQADERDASRKRDPFDPSAFNRRAATKRVDH